MEQICSTPCLSMTSIILLDPVNKYPLTGLVPRYSGKPSCPSKDKVCQELCPFPFTGPRFDSKTCDGYCCGFQTGWHTRVVPKCDGKEMPGNCEVVLERSKLRPEYPDFTPVNCSVGEGSWFYPSINCWTNNDWTDKVRIGKNTQVVLCDDDLNDRLEGCVTKYASDRPWDSNGKLSALKVSCVVEITCADDIFLLSSPLSWSGCTAPFPSNFEATATHINNDPITKTHVPTGTLKLGENDITFTASDKLGNSASCTARVTIVNPMCTPCPCVRHPDWRNHGDYVKCVALAAENLVAQKAITAAQQDDIVAVAADSPCGRKVKKGTTASVRTEETTHLVGEHVHDGNRQLLRGIMSE